MAQYIKEKDGTWTKIGGMEKCSAPVGSLLQQYKKKPMSGYLYCDGSTFDENAYPALYMYLGTNVLPDYRECVMVGAEQNTTDTIATHDVYGEGEFKDDQLQDHKHNLKRFGFNGGGSSSLSTSDFSSNIDDNNKTDYYTLNVANARTGDTNTTHGKQKAVYVYIKATSGLAENQQENVLNDVKEYIRRSNELSPIEDFTISKTNQTAQYDGFLFVCMIGNNDVETQFYVNDELLLISQSPSKFYNTVTIPLCKGDTIRVNRTAAIIYWTKARWYKNR